MGAGLGVSLRYVRQFTEKTAGRVVAKAGLAGLELELGATQRVSEFSTAGMGVSVGTQVPHAPVSMKCTFAVCSWGTKRERPPSQPAYPGLTAEVNWIMPSMKGIHNFCRDRGSPNQLAAALLQHRRW